MSCRHYCGRLAACDSCNPPIAAACMVEETALRPFEKRCDRPFTNLSEVHHAGAEGLNRTFAPGTLWDYGPFVEGQKPTIVRILPKGAYTSGENYSKQPKDSCALGNPTWFIACEVVYDPFNVKRPNGIEGLPPHTLVPHVGCDTCHACWKHEPCYNCTAGCLQSQRAEIETLSNELESTCNSLEAALAEVARLNRHVAASRKQQSELSDELTIVSRRNRELHRKLAQAKKALA